MCRRCKSICRFDVLTESGAEPEKYTRATCAGCASLFFKSRCATFGVLVRVCRKAFSGVFIYVVYKGAFSKKNKPKRVKLFYFIWRFQNFSLPLHQIQKRPL